MYSLNILKDFAAFLMIKLLCLKIKNVKLGISSQVPVLMPMDLMVEASPRRVFANAHTYHINSISINSDCETYLSADDLRINLWHQEITDRSFSILLCAPLKYVYL